MEKNNKLRDLIKLLIVMRYCSWFEDLRSLFGFILRTALHARRSGGWSWASRRKLGEHV